MIPHDFTDDTKHFLKRIKQDRPLICRPPVQELFQLTARHHLPRLRQGQTSDINIFPSSDNPKTSDRLEQ